MATTQESLTRADDCAWDLFFEALDAGSDAAAWVPPGAAIVAADAPDRAELVRRYHADRRSVVVVDEDGRTETLRPSHQLQRLLVLGGLALLAWFVIRSGGKASA